MPEKDFLRVVCNIPASRTCQNRERLNSIHCLQLCTHTCASALEPYLFLILTFCEFSSTAIEVMKLFTLLITPLLGFC